MQSSESSASPKTEVTSALGGNTEPGQHDNALRKTPQSSETPEVQIPPVSTQQPDRGPSVIRSVLVWLVRIIVGGVFMASGFAKAVDPWGGLYKIGEYLTAWDITASHAAMLVLACALAMFEFTLGVAVITGCYRRGAAIVSTLFMMGMTVLTFYILREDPVSDCGCFGDAFVLSNTVTFWKNVLLLALTVTLVIWGRRIRGLYMPQFQWLPMAFSAIYILILQVIGYAVQPIVDFRPFPVGTDMVSMAAEEADQSQDMLFVYQKDGHRQTFSVDSLPDETWEYIDRILPESVQIPQKMAFFKGDEEVTSDILKDSGDQYIIAVSDPQRFGISRSEMANRLYKFAKEKGDDMFCVVALPPDSVASWRTRMEANYPVYTADDTELKMLVRGDAGFVMLRDGKIIYKTNIYRLAPYFPLGKQTVDDLLSERDDGLLPKMTIIWVIAMVVTYVLSRFAWFMTNIRRPKTKRAKSEDPKHNRDSETTC